MKDIIRKKLEEIRCQHEDKSYDELKNLGWINMDSVTISKKKYWPAVWSEVMHDEKCLFVAQLTRWHLLRIIGTTDCIGFLLTKNGEKEYVDEEYLMNEVGHP